MSSQFLSTHNPKEICSTLKCSWIFKNNSLNYKWKLWLYKNCRNIYYISIFKDDIVSCTATYIQQKTLFLWGTPLRYIKYSKVSQSKSMALQSQWLVMSQKYCTKSSFLFYIHNPAVVIQFFSLYGAVALFHFSDRVHKHYRFSEQPSMKSPVCIMQFKRPSFTLLLAKKCVVWHFTPLTSITVKIPNTK